MQCASIDLERRSALTAAAQRVFNLSGGTWESETLTVLGKVLVNLAAQPLNDKFRKLRVTNAKINKAVVEVDGAEPLLVAVGFVRDGSNEFLQMEDAGLSAEAVSERARMALDVLAVTKARVSAPGASRPLHPSPCITDDETLRDT
jgi:hypothetical protein